MTPTEEPATADESVPTGGLARATEARTAVEPGRDGTRPADGDTRRGGHADRAPRSLTSVELAPDDEDLASNEDWDEPGLL